MRGVLPPPLISCPKNLKNEYLLPYGEMGLKTVQNNNFRGFLVRLDSFCGNIFWVCRDIYFCLATCFLFQLVGAVTS